MASPRPSPGSASPRSARRRCGRARAAWRTGCARPRRDRRSGSGCGPPGRPGDIGPKASSASSVATRSRRGAPAGAAHSGWRAGPGSRPLAVVGLVQRPEQAHEPLARQAAGPEQTRPLAGEIDDGALKADRAGATVEDQRHCRAELGRHVLAVVGLTLPEGLALGAATGAATASSRAWATGCDGHPHAPPCRGRPSPAPRHRRPATRGSTSVSGPGQKAPASASARRSKRRCGGPPRCRRRGRSTGCAPAGPWRCRWRRPPVVGREAAQAVDRLGREGDQPALQQGPCRLLDRSRRGPQDARQGRPSGGGEPHPAEPHLGQRRRQGQLDHVAQQERHDAERHRLLHADDGREPAGAQDVDRGGRGGDAQRRRQARASARRPSRPPRPLPRSPRDSRPSARSCRRGRYPSRACRRTPAGRRHPARGRRRPWRTPGAARRRCRAGTRPASAASSAPGRTAPAPWRRR